MQIIDLIDTAISLIDLVQSDAFKDTGFVFLILRINTPQKKGKKKGKKKPF
ncbi:hypothetical protein [Metabacillus fastidiosus]|uniref:hypothetical protein n=1 Tax=Metabacillus fastidiosus TaxID=1458 RepID=UPI000A4AD203|nr:hypothetical protein [Metabacillus fastidiosus]MED4464750.1 hypothetical protein [Metabacillus fastidiosus]